MAVRGAVLEDLPASIPGMIARDPRTGDWLLILSSRLRDPASRCDTFNALVRKLDEWERRGYATAEARQYLRRAAG